MKFILINGRTPRPQAVCVSGREPIATGYLRAIGTQLCYCDDECYASHRKRSVLAIENHARAS
jgi:hypothetical protein